MGKTNNVFIFTSPFKLMLKYLQIHFVYFLDFFIFKTIIEFMYSIEIIFLSYLQRGINKEILIVLPAVSMIVSRSQQTLIKADFFF